jgi:heme/copper-type cytochrome/quinol oxidase subunit 2
LVLALGGIILVAVVYAIIAAFKYVTSQGESGKMEDAQKSIKAIFIGVAAMIIAIVGVIIVFAVFGAKPTNPDLLQTCISAPTSAACEVCRKSGDTGLCKSCEDAITAYCRSNAPANDAGKDFAQIVIDNPSLTGVCK